MNTIIHHSFHLILNKNEQPRSSFANFTTEFHFMRFIKIKSINILINLGHIPADFLENKQFRKFSWFFSIESDFEMSRLKVMSWTKIFILIERVYSSRSIRTDFTIVSTPLYWYRFFFHSGLSKSKRVKS